ncbi:hypothetical protein EHO61_05100 [Leptospira fluminis]|uniref:Uncharacterized protein n=1 Tax=Leptospira fluminis TaxID=2484979 RepID=A0A4R9GSQ0_9LEPT|nr:hypothetical protein [Leptospira fluminis]TGK21224.1 hypothetical protein EHO61_05100 [Leptospira fluminis]
MSAYSAPFSVFEESGGFLNDLRTRRPISFFGGLIAILVLPAYLVLMAFDERTVLGINPWIKPAKFAISIWIFNWTMGWILDRLNSEYSKFKSKAELYFAVAMAVELSLITLQAARGVSSHFNQSTPFDGIVYGIMGLFIFPVIPVAILIDRKFIKPISGLDDRIVLSIRMSLWIFVFASLAGSYMSAINAHSVGVPDGGEGIPLLNWSKQGGDFRIAHFLGIHSLQILPIFAWLAVRKNLSRTSVLVTSLIFASLTLALFVNALLGRPLY